MTKEKLANYDIVFFYTTGDLKIPQQTLDYFFNDWLKQRGHGFIGTHSASDTYHNFRPYLEMLGGEFQEHPWGNGSKVWIKVHDKNFPAMKPWGDEFEIADEIYHFKNFEADKVHVLMSMDMAKTAMKKPYHEPIAWCRDYGKGKVFYISLGHDEKVWANPKYQAVPAGRDQVGAQSRTGRCNAESGTLQGRGGKSESRRRSRGETLIDRTTSVEPAALARESALAEPVAPEQYRSMKLHEPRRRLESGLRIHRQR